MIKSKEQAIAFTLCISDKKLYKKNHGENAMMCRFGINKKKGTTLFR